MALVPEESNALEAVWAGGFNFCRREMIRRIEALPAQPDYAEALKVARDALLEYERRIREIMPLFVMATQVLREIPRDLYSRMDEAGARDWRTPAVHAALAHIDALIGGNDHEN